MSRYALIGIQPNTLEVLYLAVCGDHLQEHWSDMPKELIPAIVPIEKAREMSFVEAKEDQLTEHIFKGEI